MHRKQADRQISFIFNCEKWTTLACKLFEKEYRWTCLMGPPLGIAKMFTV